MGAFHKSPFPIPLSLDPLTILIAKCLFLPATPAKDEAQ